MCTFPSRDPRRDRSGRMLHLGHSPDILPDACPLPSLGSWARRVRPMRERRPPHSHSTLTFRALFRPSAGQLRLPSFRVRPLLIHPDILPLRSALLPTVHPKCARRPHRPLRLSLSPCCSPTRWASRWSFPTHGILSRPCMRRPGQSREARRGGRSSRFSCESGARFAMRGRAVVSVLALCSAL